MSKVYLHLLSRGPKSDTPEEFARKLVRIKKWLKDEFGIETLEQLKAAIKAEKPVDLGIFVLPIYGKSESAIHHINEADLLSFIKSNRQITGRIILKNIHQHRKTLGNYALICES